MRTGPAQVGGRAARLGRFPLHAQPEHGCAIGNVSRLPSLFGRWTAASPVFVIDVHKHLYHTQKFNSGIAETDIAVTDLGA